MKRVVLDTNVTVSALFWKGYPRVVLDLIRTRRLVMLWSKEIEQEFIQVLGYSRFGLTAKEIFPLVKDLRECAELVETKSKISAIAADPTDNIFLECAVDGQADYVLSGDKHLLALGMYGNILIIKAKEFFKRENIEL